MDMADKDFSRKLKDLRLKAGYSQKEVYEHFGIPQSTFSSWEVGKSEPPGDMLIKLCQFYKCDMINSLSSNKEDSVTYEEWKMVEKYRFISTNSPDGASVVDTILDRECEIAKKFQENKKRIEELEKNINTEKKIANYSNHVSEDTPDYLIVQAAHNDAEINEDELSKMKSDIERLKRGKNNK